jgi:hypothetical protein
VVVAKPTRKEQEIIDAAMKRLERCVKADEDNRAEAIDDLNFISGSQWDEGEKQRRADKGRPALQINLLDKFCTQVEGDMLQNSPSIKVRPVDSRADINIAKIRQGIISNIEYLSNAKGVYGYGGKQMVRCGYGAWRVLTRYTEENPFLQEVYLESIRNPFLVYLDPDSKDQNYADAKYGFILDRMTEDQFKEKYPKGKFPSAELKYGQGLQDEHWYDGDNITVAEYFTVDKESVELLQLSDGRVVDQEEYNELKKEWLDKNKNIMQTLDYQLNTAIKQIAENPPVGGAPPMEGEPGGQPAPPVAAGGPPSDLLVGQQPQAGPPLESPLIEQINSLGPDLKVVKRRMTDRPVLRHRILTCCEILEGGYDGVPFPGKYIPIVLVKGRELNIEGKNHVFSLIRFAKDPQKLVNYWNTAAAEMIALAPKAPWLGTPRQFEGYENDYLKANVENYPMLKYNPDPEAPGPPQRQQPSNPPVAIFEQIRRGEENIKSVIGMFNADMGDAGPERTGAAINARQKPGDIGTSEFMENLSRAILYTGRIINEMIPEIYDTERDVRIRNVDDTESFTPINTTVGDAAQAISRNPEMYRGLDPKKITDMMVKEGREARFNDITVGKYDVVISTGPSYATQRQEAADHLLQLVSSMPQQMAVAADLIVENLDFKDSDELAARLRKALPPGLVKLRPGEEPPPPPPPDPAAAAAQAKMQAEQTKIQLGQMKLESEKIRADLEKTKLQAEIQIAQLQIQLKTAEMGQNNGQTRQLEDALSAQRVKLEADRLELEKQRFAHKATIEQQNMHHKQTIDMVHHQHQQAMDIGSQRLESDKLNLEKKKLTTQENDDESEDS